MNCHKTKEEEDYDGLAYKYNLLLKNSDNMLESLCNLTDIVMLLPICKNEYPQHKEDFCRFDSALEILKNVIYILEDSGITVKVPEYLAKLIDLK